MGLSKGTVLIIEDERDARDLLKEAIESEGYTVDVAENGRVALDHLHVSPPPQVILLDLSLPVMDGWDFLEERRKYGSLLKVPVVVITAFKVAHLHSDMTTILRKPYDLRTLLDEIRRFATA